jgi:PKD repeat protein
VKDNLGAITTEIFSISIDNVVPTAYFTSNPEKPLTIQEVTFIDDSTDIDGSIVKWVWFIDNELIHEGSFFQYQFPNDGTYQVTLKVIDDDEEESSYSITVTVLNVGPQVSFTFYTDDGSIVKKKPIHFNDNSYDPDGNITSYYWEFGDGKSSKQKEPTHSYENDGIYKVSLTVQDDDGVKKTISKELTVGTISEGNDILGGFSIFDIVIIVVILIAVISVFIISKKFG